MTTTNDSLKLAELLKTPICKMDGKELAFLITSITNKKESHETFVTLWFSVWTR